jgi:chloramphenicol 3-O-phosphotransferase
MVISFRQASSRSPDTGLAMTGREKASSNDRDMLSGFDVLLVGVVVTTRTGPRRKRNKGAYRDSIGRIRQM